MTLNRRTLLTFGASLPVLALTANAGFAQGTPTFYAEDGIAIDGTDPVAYFTDGAPVAGDPTITHDWMARHGALPPLRTKMRSWPIPKHTPHSLAGIVHGPWRKVTPRPQRLKRGQS